MKKILLVTHSHMASGIRSTVDFLCSMGDTITAIDAYVEEGSDIEKPVADYFATVTDEDKVVIFTDGMFGSVNQYFMRFLQGRKNCWLISGINLPVVLEVTLTGEEISDDYINRIIGEAREQLVLCPTELVETADDELF